MYINSLLKYVNSKNYNIFKISTVIHVVLIMNSEVYIHLNEQIKI